MKCPDKAERLRIYIGENDRLGKRLLSEAIMQEAMNRGLSGGTAYRGIMGFGANSKLHTNKILVLAEDMPMIVEIIDSAEKIDAFLPWLDEVVAEGLVTREPVEISIYRHT